MADGFENSRTEAWFNGQLRPGKIPKRRKTRSPQAQVSESPAAEEVPRGRRFPTEKDDGTAN